MGANNIKGMEQGRLHLIAGGAGGGRTGAALALPDAPQFSAPELAAEMAELFTFGLLRDCPIAELGNPHAIVPVDAACRFTLHEMLCELRNLSWCDAGSAASLAQRAERGATLAGHRQTLRWNDDGQLTLRTAFRSGVQHQQGAALSALIAADHSVAEPCGPLAPLPETAPVSDWVHWCAMHSGAGLRLPGAVVDPAAAPSTLGGLAAQVQSMPPSRPFLNAALGSLAAATPLDPGLQGAPWKSGRLFAVLADAERRAVRAAVRTMTRADRLSRPAVIAARLSVFLERDDASSGPETASLQAAATELATATPNLLNWVTGLNTVLRGKQRLQHCLFLPLIPAGQMPPHPANVASHVVVAGALATVLKAVFDTSPAPQLSAVGTTASDPQLARELDALASNVAMARVVLGTHFPAENHQDLRLGETIGLQVLRECLERDNRSARVTLRNFDGQEVQVVAHPRVFGRGFAELHCAGQPVAWPQDKANPAAHLTAVV